MARRQYRGEIRVEFVPVIADTDAPTVAEINGGVDLTPFLKADGITTPQTGSTINIADMSSLFNKTAPGSYGGDSISIKAYRDSDADSAYNVLVRGVSGHIVIRRFGGSDVAIAVSDDVEVWTGTVISSENSPSADNEPQSFTASFSVEEAPVEDAVVAA